MTSNPMKSIYIHITTTQRPFRLVVVTKRIIFDIPICERASPCSMLILGVRRYKTKYIYFFLLQFDACAGLIKFILKIKIYKYCKQFLN